MRAHCPNLNSPDMLTLKGHQHVRVNTRFVKLVVPSRHRVPKLSLLFPSSPPPRELPDQTRHTPDVVSLQAFRNSRIYPRHCYSILFSGFHTHRRIDELVVHELQYTCGHSTSKNVETKYCYFRCTPSSCSITVRHRVVGEGHFLRVICGVAIVAKSSRDWHTKVMIQDVN